LLGGRVHPAGEGSHLLTYSGEGLFRDRRGLGLIAYRAYATGEGRHLHAQFGQGLVRERHCLDLLGGRVHPAGEGSNLLAYSGQRLVRDRWCPLGRLERPNPFAQGGFRLLELLAEGGVQPLEVALKLCARLLAGLARLHIQCSNLLAQRGLGLFQRLGRVLLQPRANAVHVIVQRLEMMPDPGHLLGAL